MLKSNFPLMLFFLLFVISCKNEEVISPGQLSSAVNQNATPPVNIAPNVFAGEDIYRVFPINSVMLKGSAQFAESIYTASWNKVSGPGSFVIENPFSLETKVRNLEKGVYDFELTIYNIAGLRGKDTVSVTILVEGTGKNELIFQGLQWRCPMGCHLRIENFDDFVPIFTAFKVYIRRGNSTQWVEVVNSSQAWSKYNWTIYNNGLYIMEDQTEDEDPTDTPDVKIVF